MDTGLLKLTGAVKLHQNDGMELNSGSAVFQQKENWATASEGVLIKSKNGWIRGQQAKAELTPATYHPKTIVVEGSVFSESTTADGARWKLRSGSVQAAISAKGIAERVVAQTNVELEKIARDSNLDLTGAEVEAHMTNGGQVSLIEARSNARMKFADDRFLTSNKIVSNPNGGVVTEGDSVLQIGDSRITGRTFDIQNGDITTFRTANRATLNSNGRETTGDRTDATFDSHTNQLVSLNQTGHFRFKEAERQGQAQKARFEDGGTIVFLEGDAKVSDPKTQVQAQTIELNDKTKTQSATKNVVTVSTDSGDRVLVKADAAQQTQDSVTYTGHVRLYRSGATIEADRIEGPAGAKVFRANAAGHVFSTMNNIRAWSDKLDYDDQTRIAHYVGNVIAQKQDLKITGADMVVKLRDSAVRPAVSGPTAETVSEITTTGNVVVTRANGRGTGDRAVYTADTQQVVLTGPAAELTDGEGTTTKGPRITVNVAGDKMAVVEGSGDKRTVTTHRVSRP